MKHVLFIAALLAACQPATPFGGYITGKVHVPAHTDDRNGERIVECAYVPVVPVVPIPRRPQPVPEAFILYVAHVDTIKEVFVTKSVFEHVKCGEPFTYYPTKP